MFCVPAQLLHKGGNLLPLCLSLSLGSPSPIVEFLNRFSPCTLPSACASTVICVGRRCLLIATVPAHQLVRWRSAGQLIRGGGGGTRQVLGWCICRGGVGGRINIGGVDHICGRVLAPLQELIVGKLRIGIGIGILEVRNSTKLGLNRGYSARGRPLASDALGGHVVVMPIESVETRASRRRGGKYREAGEVPYLSQALSMRECLGSGRRRLWFIEKQGPGDQVAAWGIRGNNESRLRK